MRRVTSFLSGSLVGALAGAALALLFAPSSGEELRQQMQERRLLARDLESKGEGIWRFCMFTGHSVGGAA